MSKRSLAKLARISQKLSRRLIHVQSDVADYYLGPPVVRQHMLQAFAQAIRALDPAQSTDLVASTRSAARFLLEAGQAGFPDGLRKPGGRLYHPASVLLFAGKALSRTLAELERRPTPVLPPSNPLPSPLRTR